MVSIVPDGRLVYGMQLQVQSQSAIYAEEWEAKAGADALAAIGRKADATGFYYVAVCDHVAIPKPFDERMRTTWYDTVATLGWLAALTERVRLMSHVFVLPYRHPLVAAKSFMTLDHLSGGRAIMGVGTGHVEPEFRLLGVDFEGRGRITTDAIDEVWAAFLSEYVHDAGMAPRPEQAPVPIWVGGSTRGALRRAAERGDGWLPQGVPQMGLAEAIAYIRRIRGDEPIEIGANSPWLYVGTPRFDLGPNARSGRGEAIAALLRDLQALGVSHVGVRFRTRSVDELLEQIDAFAREVAPHL